jgi:DNA polymerase-1
VLLELRKTNPHKLLELTLQYKSWSHGISTLQSYLDVADEEGVIHPNIHTCQAITGRESCSNPNLQNVEKDVGALKNPYPVPARSVFRPRPGHVNFHLDYSGIEMRLLIHYSGDEELVRICREGGDVHIPWAEVFYGDRFRNAVGAERDKLRDATKGADFGIGYGASAQTTSTTLGVSLQEGVRILAECRKRFPKMIGLMRKITGMVLSNGFVKTAFGRPLHVPRSQAYIGTNYLIQGTAAEILKRGQIAAHHYLKEATGGEVSLLLPIHDELIIEFPRKQLTEAPHVLGKVCKLMTGFPGRFNVPLGVSVSVATADWANKKKFEVA